jgi:hypothetical protein
MSKRAFAAPLLIVAVGLGWLLNVSDVLEAVDWVWTLLLATSGLLAFLTGGWNKVTFVLGTLLLIAGVLSIFRQLGKIDLEHEFPILVILLGVLWAIAERLRLPMPDWTTEKPS